MKRSIKTSTKKLSFTSVAMLVFLLFFSRAFYRLAKSIWQYHRTKVELSREIKRNVRLKQEIELCKKDYFMDYLARTELGLKKEGEIEYRFNPPVEKNEDRDF